MKKNMLPVIIFLSILFTYIASHVLVYFSLVNFFGITSSVTKNVFLGGLLLLALSFFVSTFLAHVFNDAFFRGLYLFTGFWAGLLVNLVLFFVLAWGIIWIGSVLHLAVNHKTLGVLAVIFASIYSAYGVWNAFTPKVTSMTVAIDDLPKEWVGKKIVQISDVHLGHVYGSEYLSEVVKKINSLKPDVVVITGDLFDGVDGISDSIVVPLNNIKAPSFFVTGNHETYIGIEKAYSKIAKTKLIPLRDELRNINGLQFIGVDYPLKGKDRDIAEIIPNMEGWNQFAPSILLIHEPVQIESAKKVGISLQLSGHTHKGQLFPFGIISSLVFGGYDYGFKREGSYAIYTSSGLGGWGPPMRTERRSEIVEITLR